MCPSKGVPSHKILANNLSYISTVQADVAVFLVGSNDVLAPNVTPRMLARALVGAAGYSLLLGPKRVIIGLLFPRRSKKFNKVMNRVNSEIIRAIREEGDGRIRYWRHKGLWISPRRILKADGTHLNRPGQWRLYRSMRGCILKNNLHFY